MVKTRKNMYKNNLNTIVFIVLILGNITAFAQSAPVVSNVTFVQRTDGSLKVDVYYDVYDADGDTLYVTLQASSDNGATWALPVSNITGAVGSNILSGTNKQIVWNFGQERPNFFSDQVKVKVVATDIKCVGLTVEYGGKTYTTVQIGSQCWLKENLDIGIMIQGTQDASNNGVIEKYCYDNNPSNCVTYGGFYLWNEAMQYVTAGDARGICPIGWHLPGIEDYQILANSVNNDGHALKAVGQGGGTNISGFTALLTGARGNTGGGFGNMGGGAYFWSSNEQDASSAYLMLLSDSNSSINFYYYSKTYGFSVRCLKD